MEDGRLAYEVHIQVSADFDGTITPPEEGADLGRAMHVLMASMAEEDPDVLLRAVCHREKHLLCPACKDRYLANPLNLPLRPDLP